MSFVSDILSNTRRASSRTKKRQQKQQKIITTKPSSDRPLREREKTQQKSKVADREERERERERDAVEREYSGRCSWSAVELRWAVLRWVAVDGFATREKGS
jgi:hypothetical protein